LISRFYLMKEITRELKQGKKLQSNVMDMIFILLRSSLIKTEKGKGY